MDWPQGYSSFQEKMGWFYKKGCRVEFTIKTLYLFNHVLKLCFIQRNHINQEGLHVHEDLKMGGIYIYIYIYICCSSITTNQGFCDGKTKAWIHNVSNHVKT
jgi:hypothetical protein